MNIVQYLWDACSEYALYVSSESRIRLKAFARASLSFGSTLMPDSLWAMSAGKPVVATKIPGSGVSWVNAHKESGINVEPKDSEALAKAFKRILDAEDTYNAYSEQASQRYWTMFTKTKMIEKCIEIYKNL